ASATARALRSDPARTTDVVRAAASVTCAPFGDGSTQRRPAGASRYDAGASEYRACRRRPASSASWVRANSAAAGSAHGYGRIAAPRDTATSTHVVNENTSTTMVTSAGARAVTAC